MKKRLIIFEIANNHMGDVNHGILIIDKFSKFIEKYKDYFSFAMKFQMRDLDTFIHNRYKNRMDLKYVKRFSETSLSLSDFKLLSDKAKSLGFITMCTAFDENSVDNIIKIGFNTIKVASCSMTDWPLLNKIVDVSLPIVISSAGNTIDDIDKVVSFLSNRNKTFSLMHCIGEYPTERKNYQLNQINFLKNRYQNISIGLSTHENPQEYIAIQLAIAKGAELFEKHIGIKTDKYELNNYSVDDSQMEVWLDNAVEALNMCGIENERHIITEREKFDLLQFKRGVFVKEDIKKGEIIDRNNVYYSWPSIENQIIANDMSKYVKFIAEEDILKDSPVLSTQTNKINIRQEVWNIVQKVKTFLLKSNITFPGQAQLELSHHHGIDKFYDFGSTMITVINREYCKKIIIMLPKQLHPAQYHKQKEETFLVLYGDLKLKLDGKEMKLNRGDVITVEPNQVHEFTSENGCIIEEISSTHYIDDSYYLDNKILENKNRKTFVNYWL